MAEDPKSPEIGQPCKGLPTRLRILGKDWRVSHEPDLIAQKQSYGRCQIARATIQYTTVDDEGGPWDEAMIRDTVLHEAVHAISESLGLDLRERQVLALGASLLALLRENPDFVRWLMGPGDPEN